MEIHLIWAQDINSGIGVNGKLPWYIPEDLKNFKKITNKSIVIMGRKTWDSLPIKPLPNRRNIVFSHKIQKNVETIHSYQDCLSKLKNDNVKKIFVIGGRAIYNLFYNDAHFLHITKINLINPDINEYFPIQMKSIKNTFKQVSEKIISNKAIYTYWNKL